MKRSGLIARLEKYFRDRDLALSAVYLYGSVARDEAREGSDIDLGLLFREEPPAVLSGPAARIEAELEATLGIPVQAVVLQRAPVDLVHRVLRDGILVFEGDASLRVRFEVDSRNEYFDLLPHLQRYRAAGAAPRGSGAP